MAKKSKRILFISNTRLRYTNILTSILLSLIEMGFYVKEIDVLQHPGIKTNPLGLQGGQGPVEIKYDCVKQEIESFNPHIIILAAGGLTFTEEKSHYLINKGIKLLGITLSDPDVFKTVVSYAKRFSVHTTNAKASMKEYRNLGFNNTFYMPFGIDSRFFVPTAPNLAHSCDVVVIGHYQPTRLGLTNTLRKKFDTKIHGSRWPYEDVKPVAYPEWLKAVHSGKIVIDFPQTRAGYHNVKVRLFETAAAGTPLITQYLDEISEFFEYDKEIIGYNSEAELFDKIQYYLAHPDKRIKIARNAQLKCARKHMWQNRFSDLFAKTGLL